jgi:hypothetical protein
MKLPKLENKNKSIEEKFQLGGMVHEKEDFNKKYLEEFKSLKRADRDWKKKY